MFRFFFSFDHGKKTKGKLCSCSWQQIPSILPFDKRLNIYGHFKTMAVMYCLLEKLKLGIEVELCSCYYSSMCQSRTYSCIFCQLFFLGGQKLLSSYVHGSFSFTDHCSIASAFLCSVWTQLLWPSVLSISCMLLGFVPIGSHCSSEAGVIVPFPKKFFFLLFSFFSLRVSEGFVDCVGRYIRVLVSAFVVDSGQGYGTGSQCWW